MQKQLIDQLLYLLRTAKLPEDTHLTRFASYGELVPGSFRSLRGFGIAYSLNHHRVVLTPVTTKKTVYPDQGWHTAKCMTYSMKNNLFYKGKYSTLNRITWDKDTAQFYGEYVQRSPSDDVPLFTSFVKFESFRKNRETTIRVPLKDIMQYAGCDTPPRPECQCGFYSFYDLASTLRGESYIRPHVGTDGVLGVVENAGRVLHGTLGLRSERMRIVGWMWLSTFAERLPTGMIFGAPPSRYSIRVPYIRHQAIGNNLEEVMNVDEAMHRRAALEDDLNERIPFYASYSKLIEAHPLSDPPSAEPPASPFSS